MKLLSFEKKLGLFGAVSVTVGAVIGVAIFVMVGEIGALSGPWTAAAFGIAAIPAIFGTVVAIALGSTIPADGGGFYYTKSLLGQKPGIVASWLIVFGALGSIAAVSLGVADYIRYFLPETPAWSRPAIAIAIIAMTWGVNTIGIMASEKFQILMVLQLASALIILVIVALAGGGNPDFSQPLPSGTVPFMEATAMAVLSYTGFNIIGELGDEIENPRRNIPLTIIIGLGVITIIYVGVGWIVSGTLTAGEMELSKAALLDTAKRYMSDHPWFLHYLNLGAIFGAVTSINAVFLAVPREFAAQAADRLLPDWIMKFNKERQTFPNGIMVVAIAGSILVLPSLAVGIYGLLCVAGLILANVFFSVGVVRIFKLYPEKVATAPVPLRRWWVTPCAIISAIASLAFGLLAVFFFIQELLKVIGGS